MNMRKMTLFGVAVALLFAGGMIGRLTHTVQDTRNVEQAGSQKVLYYRHPMGLADTSLVPKKDSMGMDYIPVYADAVVSPVYEEEEASGNLVRLTQDKVQKLGVLTEAVTERIIQREVRAVGTIETNERTLTTVAPRFEGWIETLYANETGGAVKRGAPLFAAYSPELVAAQQELLLALQSRQSLPGSLGDDLIRMARERLRNWQVDESDIRALETSGTPQRAVVFRSPMDGIVLEKMAVQGARFMPGEALYLLADLRTVWLIASVYEQDLSTLQLNQPVTLAVEAYPGETFAGHISFIYPTLVTETRTARFRVEFANANLNLRPGMYGQINVQPAANVTPVPSVSDSALLDSGKRRIVLVQVGEGLFEPREVEVGRRSDGYIEIRKGLAVGELVVVSANFLIDAESNLKAALSSFSQSASNAVRPPDAAVEDNDTQVELEDHRDHKRN